MKLVLDHPKTFIDSVSIISELVNEARFKFTSDSIELIAMDAANVAMIIFKLLASSFKEYTVEGDLEIAINLANFKKILRRAKATDVLSLESNENKLILKFTGKSTKRYSMPTIELEERNQKIPSLNFTSTITMPSADLVEAIDDVSIISESVTFSAEKETFSISGEGDLSKANVDIASSEQTSIAISGDSEKISSKYSIEYLKKMIVGDKISADVHVLFSKDYPLKLEYKIIDRVELSFILAPRVDN